MIRKLLSASLLLLATTAMAVPAWRAKRTIKLADGTQKMVTLCGDENMRFFLDAEGNAYTEQPGGTFVRGNKAALTKVWNERLQARNKHRIERAVKLGLIDDPAQASNLTARQRLVRKAKWGAEQNPISGSKKGLVILVNFSDKKMDATHDQTFFNGYFNTVGFNKLGCKGSVHDYFLESSYGKFDLTFDVIGPVTVSRAMNYYGQNIDGVDGYPATMVTEACKLADLQGVDFSKYDWDGDGYVDQIFLVYAGYGENMGGAAYTIWPHESKLSDAQPYGDGQGAIRLDGVTVDTYAVSCELFGSTGNTIAGIGTACHEFSHCMCIPDMYDAQSLAYGMDAWDLMDYGAYNGDMFGECPTAYTAYERMYCGWLTPTVLDTPCRVSDMKPLNEAPEAYIIYNDNNHNEYYMLENRQQKGFNSYDAAHGMLVTHVFFDPEAWKNNTVNTTSLQHMTIIPADATYSHESNSGDTYPGKTKNTALSDETTPAAKLYNANVDGRSYMGHAIEDITEQNGTISFLFDGGTAVDAPQAQAATDLTPTSFTAHWTAVTGADGYEVELTSSDLKATNHPISDVAIMEEDFHGFNNGTEKNGTEDVSSKLDELTVLPGWEASNIYTTPNDMIRIGNSRLGQVQGGYVISPWLPTASHDITVTFTVKGYSSDTDPIYLIMGEGQEGGAVGSVTPEKEPFQVVLNATTDTDEWWFGLQCQGRCYVCEMSAYEGHLTEEQIDNGFIEAQVTERNFFEATTNSYPFTGLSADKGYSYRVRAKVDKARSKWSEATSVTLPTTTAIEPVPALTPGTHRIYDLQGRPVTISVKRGITIKDGKKILAQ